MMRRRSFAVFSILACLSAVISGCGSGSTTLLSPSPLSERCAPALAVSGGTVGATGGSGTLRVETHRECSWTIPPQPPWIKVARSLSAQGPAEIAFTVDENRSTSSRAWEVVLGDQRAVVSQSAATCSWRLEPARLSVGPGGGEVRTTLTTEDFCSWEMSSTVSWIDAAPTSGRGATKITLLVSPNTGANRTGRLKIAGAVVEVTQRDAPPLPPRPDPPMPEPRTPERVPSPPREPDPPQLPAPCAYSVTPNALTFGHKKATGKIEIATLPQCQWSAASLAAWIKVRPGTKAGSAAIEVKVDEYSKSGTRSGVVTVTGQGFQTQVTVTQGDSSRDGDDDDDD